MTTTAILLAFCHLSRVALCQTEEAENHASRAIAAPSTSASRLLGSYDELIRTKLTRYEKNPLIPHSGIRDNWKEWQVQEAFVFNDPNDASQLIMFYSGARAPTSSGAFIGRATAKIANPFAWTDDAANPILSPGASPHNAVYIRLDTVLRLDGVFWLYSTGMSATGRDAAGNPVPGVNSIELARSTDGVHFEWHKTPMLLPSGDERDVSQAAVLKDGDDWYMYYSYRTKSGSVLPGIRLVRSTDGLHWKKTGQQILSCTPGSYDSRYYEFHQILKLGRDYVLLSECYDGTHWSIGAAHSLSPTEGWVKKDTPLFERSDAPGAFDVHHVATPTLFAIGPRVMLFYQGGNNLENYILSNWDIGVACLSEPRKP
jgi:predicted GH43/DUF377 family glycosyl hydrolase